MKDRWKGVWRKSHLSVSLLVGVVLFSLVARAQRTVSQNQFRASVVKINITPDDPQNLVGYGPRNSTGVHDSIYHKIVALDDGTTQFFLISTDICLVAPAEYDRVATKIQQLYGIDPLNVWWTVTHTHSAPEVGPPGMYAAYMAERVVEIDPAYTSKIEQQLIDGIKEAREKLVPAKMGVGWGFSQANINRRAIDVDGKASLGLNPDGPVDRRIGLIRIDKQDGSPLAIIANYAIHGTVLGGQSTVISGDAPGVVAEYVEDKLGAPVLFINGAAGNIAPIYSVYPSPLAGHLGQFRVLLGDRIIEANKKILSGTSEVKLASGVQVLETPRKPGLGWPKDMQEYSRTTKEGINMVKMPVRFLKINDDIAIWSAPIELFCEVSNEVRKRSPFRFTFYYGYTNGWFGYMPTAEEWTYGGYEVERVSPFTPTAARDLTELVVGYLERENKTPPAPPKRRKRK